MGVLTGSQRFHAKCDNRGPTLMLVKDGKTAQRFVGFRPKADFEKILDKYVK